MESRIQPHNQAAAGVWSSAGASYDQISRQIASALDHCVERVAPEPGEHVLDVATGTGWTSRLLARRGATVVGTDFAPEALATARALAHAEGLDITYELGDAEQLPFATGQFDAIVSTCGVMFASHPEAAAAELARVCRPGGRLALVTWPTDSSVFAMFQILREYMPAPPSPPPPSPFAWGNPDRVRELLGEAFDLKFEEGTTVYYGRDGSAAWDAFVAGYGPMKNLAASLDPARRAALRQQFAALHDACATPLGFALPRKYLLAVGMRRGQAA
ncbi:MAG: class I SAM-dependent methyltransferase [Terriglobales bacterium]